MAPINRNLQLQIQRALYSLKREYGARVDIYKLVSSVTDVRTGVKTRNKQLIRIKRAIVLPSKIARNVDQSISLISANKQFVTGGTIESGIRPFIIDRRDCRELPELTGDDWLVYDGAKYQIKTVEEFEPRAGWIVTAKKLLGERPEQIIPAQADHLLLFESVASAVVESP